MYVKYGIHERLYDHTEVEHSVRFMKSIDKGAPPPVVPYAKHIRTLTMSQQCSSPHGKVEAVTGTCYCFYFSMWRRTLLTHGQGPDMLCIRNNRRRCTFVNRFHKSHTMFNFCVIIKPFMYAIFDIHYRNAWYTYYKVDLPLFPWSPLPLLFLTGET